MALFESYERREKQILDVLAQYDIKSIEECREICQAKGFDPYKIVEGIQPICFENAKWAYTVGCAIALKKGVKSVTLKNKTTSATVKKLSAKKKYYVRVCTYKKVGKTTYYSAWSSAKSVTTKK